MLPNYVLAWSSLSRKHGLATFVHERLPWTLVSQSPVNRRLSGCVWMLTTIKLLTSTNLHQHGCKYPTFQCSLTPVYFWVILTARLLTGATIAAASIERASWPGQTPTTLPFSITQKMSQAFILDAGTLAQIRILLSPVLVLTIVYHTDVSWKSNYYTKLSGFY